MKCIIFRISFLHVRRSCLAAHTSALSVTCTRTTHALTFSTRAPHAQTNLSAYVINAAFWHKKKNAYYDGCTQDLARANVSQHYFP